MISARPKGRFANLSAREQGMVASLLGVAFVLATSVLLMQRHQKLRALRDESATLQQASSLVRSSAGHYRQAQRAQGERASGVPTTPLSWGTLLDEAERSSNGVKYAGFDDSMPSVPINEEIERKDAKFELRGVTMATLTAFLRTLEQNDSHPVLTQDLTLRATNGESEDRLNASVTMSSWNRRAGAKAAAAEDAAPLAGSVAAPSDEGATP
jgi:hypothetical protein